MTAVPGRTQARPDSRPPLTAAERTHAKELAAQYLYCAVGGPFGVPWGALTRGQRGTFLVAIGIAEASLSLRGRS
jgi:hypothetical protein